MTAKDMGAPVADEETIAAKLAAGLPAKPAGGRATRAGVEPRLPADMLLPDMAAPHFVAPMAAVTLRRRQVGVKSVRALLSIVLLAAMPLAGCVGPLGLQTDGSYLLERDEQEASCDSLTKSLSGRIQLINSLPARARAEQAAPPPTASSALGRWLGGTHKGLKAVEDYDRELAHAYALQRTLREKRCPSIDVDREVAQAAAEMARIRQN
jgi:hypothetical protein